MLNFLCAKNLTETTLVEGEPWTFCVPAEDNPFKKMPKAKRRLAMLSPKTDWNVYTAIRGAAKNLRISKTNPAAGMSGLVADFDMVSDIDTVCKYLDQIPGPVQPTKVETSLGGKVRLVWVFEKEILVPSTEFCIELIKAFFANIGVPTLLAGYDPASTKPTEMWTNGARWYDVNPKPLSWEYCFGILCGVSKKSALFNNGEIPMETIAKEVGKRFPNKWQGEFKLDSLGPRFWDETADNPTGCQVKPDGCLCFTGTEPFVKWESIFGRQWVEEQKVLNLGRAGEGLIFDGRNYWEQNGTLYESIARVDTLMRLTGRGLSGKCPKGATQSDAERVLTHIQLHNRVIGAAPLINHPPGMVELEGQRILNIANLQPCTPVKGLTGTPADFPLHWDFLAGLFPRPQFLPLDHFLAWLRRGLRMILEHKPFMGQAIFLCGPKNNGKTLACLQIVKPLLGNRVANPIEHMTGETTFNSELFHSALLAVNDEDAPATESARRRMNARLKGLVVNPVHKFHAKFEKPLTIYWTGRIFITLNDDIGSLGMLPEVEANTRDKMMFFASQPYKGIFPEQDILEATLAAERPAFAWWLLNVYTPPAEVLSHDRMGVVSYFDPTILELSHQQTFASNLSELLRPWMRLDAYWADNTAWEGSPTDLLTCLQTCDATTGIAQKWSQQQISKSLTALAKHEGSGVSFAEGDGRCFKITKI